MIDTSGIVDSLITIFRDIAQLVAELGGDPGRIYAYHDQFPARVSLAQAIHDMPTPSIMAAWIGTAPGTLGGVDVWKHSITLYLRAGEGGGATAYYRLFRLITKGVPTSTGVEMLNSTVHLSCYPMDPPTIQRQTDTEGMDYFEVALTFTEIGDE